MDKDYVCPGCLFFGNKIKVTAVGKHFFKCDVCLKLKDSDNNSNNHLRHIFEFYTKSGIHCEKCDRFVPLNLNGSKQIICPYPDCDFIGQLSDLKKSWHPKFVVDTIHPKYETPISIDESIRPLLEAINNQVSNIEYTSSQFTVPIKKSCYESFYNIAQKYPTEMSEYIGGSTKRYSLQSKLFQEFVNILENKLPYSCKKNGKIFVVKSLMDPNLGFFDGISEFEGVVTEDGFIKNGTQELYIGSGKSCRYTNKYYIGKLLCVKSIDLGEDVTRYVTHYSFSRIFVDTLHLNTGARVRVSHLRIPPHYQIGGMVYVNRIKNNLRAELFGEKYENTCYC